MHFRTCVDATESSDEHVYSVLDADDNLLFIHGDGNEIDIELGPHTNIAHTFPTQRFHTITLSKRPDIREMITSHGYKPFISLPC